MLAVRLLIVRLIGLILPCLLIAGCGSEPPKMTEGVKVSGKVVLPNGSPLSGGTLVLRPENGLFGATGQIQTNGTFNLGSSGQESIVPGKYQVFVRFSDPSLAKLRKSINQRYQQSSDDGDSDVIVDIPSATDALVIRLKR